MVLTLVVAAIVKGVGQWLQRGSKPSDPSAQPADAATSGSVTKGAQAASAPQVELEGKPSHKNSAHETPDSAMKSDGRAPEAQKEKKDSDDSEPAKSNDEKTVADATQAKTDGEAATKVPTQGPANAADPKQPQLSANTDASQKGQTPSRGRSPGQPSLQPKDLMQELQNCHTTVRNFAANVSKLLGAGTAELFRHEEDPAAGHHDGAAEQPAGCHPGDARRARQAHWRD